MSRATASDAADSVNVVDGTPGRRRALVLLCLTEITSWGVLYYAFPVLAPDISRSTGWPPAAVTAGLSTALVVAALVGIPAGRLLDRHGPRPVMTAGSVLAVPALAGVAFAPNLGWFLAAWIPVGVAMAGLLYPPAFAAVTRWYGRQRVRALTALTLIGGLASTVFAPTTGQLSLHLSWRHTYLVLAVVLAVVTIPAHWWGLRLQWPTSQQPSADAAGPADPTAIVRSRAFVVLVAVMGTAAFTIYAVVITQIPLLTSRGVPPATAATALGLGGLGQVAGRLGYGRFTAHTSVRARTLVILGAGAATTGLLAVIPGPTILLIAGVILAGTTRGVFTLLQATAITERWGHTHYGRLNGILSAPSTLAAALAPAAGTALAGLLGDYGRVFLVLAALGVAATVASIATIPHRPR